MIVEALVLWLGLSLSVTLPLFGIAIWRRVRARAETNVRLLCQPADLVIPDFTSFDTSKAFELVACNPDSSIKIVAEKYETTRTIHVTLALPKTPQFWLVIKPMPGWTRHFIHDSLLDSDLELSTLLLFSGRPPSFLKGLLTPSLIQGFTTLFANGYVQFVNATPDGFCLSSNLQTILSKRFLPELTDLVHFARCIDKQAKSMNTGERTTHNSR